MAGGLLFLLPLADRGPSRNPLRRKRFVGAVVLLLLGAAALGGLAERADRGNAGFQKFRVRADRDAARALALAMEGVPPAGGTAVYDNDPTEQGRKLYAERCAGCHVYGGAGERKAPDLDGWSSRGWIAAFLRDPANERFYGETKVKGMKPVKAIGADFDALVEWVYSLGGPDGVDAAKAQRGKQVFDDGGCDNCHEVDGATAGDGAPNLGQRASAAWIKRLLEDASQPALFGAKNEMPKFRGKLGDPQLDALVQLLRAERGK